MRTIEITAPSRLHFGLLAPSAGHARRFGGVGVMIQSPPLRLTARPARQFSVVGPGHERVVEFAGRWANSRARVLPTCQLAVEALPRMHSGLGVGSQLGLSVARALDEFAGFAPASPAALAASVGRGLRSAVGSYGFFHGGLIAESGKSAGEPLAPLATRIELPPAWRWVLVCPFSAGGLHGEQEQEIFSEMQNPSRDRSQELSEELLDRLLPAAKSGDFAEFSTSIYRFGYESGLSFAGVQGGAYNGPRLQAIVNEIRRLGIEGVGQSSWGPTIFALCRDESAAATIANQVREFVSDGEVLITETSNQGARIRVTETG